MRSAARSIPFTCGKHEYAEEDERVAGQVRNVGHPGIGHLEAAERVRHPDDLAESE